MDTRLSICSIACAAALVMLAACASVTAAAAPAPGDTFVYRVTNGYNKEVLGEDILRVQRSDSERTVVDVTRRRNGATATGSAIYRPDGNWLHHALTTHGFLVEFDFSPAYPDYEFPLDPGKRWSTRVNATNPATGARRSVRVDAEVAGRERIEVPAGTFDTVKILRSVYAGDAEHPLTETTIIETEWYAPALGRAVRLDRTSRWLNISVRFSLVRGDWTIHELASAPGSRTNY